MPKPIKSSTTEADVFPPEKGESWEEVRADADLDSPLSFKSKADSNKSEFLPLAPAIYELEVDMANVEDRPSFNNPAVMEKVIKLTMKVMGCSDGPIKDIEGNEQAPAFRRLWDSLSTTAVGFKNGGTEPSKTRAAICAFLKKNPDEPFTLDNVVVLRGKRCKVFVDKVTKKDGSFGNKLSKYIAV